MCASLASFLKQAHDVSMFNLEKKLDTIFKFDILKIFLKYF